MSLSYAKPRILVSSCLLGEKVRYDGDHKLNRWLPILSEWVEFVSLCPEMEMGLGVPREPIAWFDSKLKTLDQEKDFTTLAQETANRLMIQVQHIDSAILKSKSPSCGLKVTDHIQKTPRSGFFADLVKQTFPGALVVDENALISQNDLLSYISKLNFNDVALKHLHLKLASLA